MLRVDSESAPKLSPNSDQKGLQIHNIAAGMEDDVSEVKLCACFFYVGVYTTRQKNASHENLWTTFLTTQSKKEG